MHGWQSVVAAMAATVLGVVAAAFAYAAYRTVAWGLTPATDERLATAHTVVATCASIALIVCAVGFAGIAWRIARNHLLSRDGSQ